MISYILAEPTTTKPNLFHWWPKWLFLLIVVITAANIPNFSSKKAEILQNTKIDKTKKQSKAKWSKTATAYLVWRSNTTTIQAHEIIQL
jgi:hypothetical protein